MDIVKVALGVLFEALIISQLCKAAVPVTETANCTRDIAFFRGLRNADSSCMTILVVDGNVHPYIPNVIVPSILKTNGYNTTYVIDYIFGLRDIRHAHSYSYSGYELEDVVLIFKTYNKLVTFYHERSISRLMVNPQGRYYVILYDQCYGSERKIRAGLLFIFRKIWKIDSVMNLVFIVLCSKDRIACVMDSLRFMYSYDQFAKAREGQWGLLIKEDFKEAEDLHVQVIRNLNGYPLTVTMFPSTMAILKPKKKRSDPDDYEGLDMMYAKIIAEKLNFAPIYRRPSGLDPYGNKLPNGSFTGMIGDLSTERTDLCFVGSFIRDYETSALAFSPTILQDSLCIMVPKAHKIPGWTLLSRCFSTNVWICILALIAIASLLYIGFRKKSAQEADLGNTQNTYEPAWIIVAALLSSPISEMPVLTSERVFLSFCLIWSLTMVTGAFQGSLTYVYSTPMFYPDITSLEMLDESGLPIAIATTGLLKDMFGVEPKGTVLGNLRRKVKIYDTMEHILRDFDRKQNISVIERMLNIIILTRRYVNSDGSTRAFMVPECPRRYLVAYVLPKRSPYLESIKMILFHLNENGFKKKWLLETLRHLLAETTRMRDDDEEEEHAMDGYIQLNLGHLQIAFILLMLGSLLSMGVFIWEVWTYRRMEKQKLVEESAFQEVLN